ncbi:Hypoxic response protein 1 [Hartmannibacter diazotrophicus]|uniref:Hypoxic response protein 1 n=1 Tax=Hartmannibacter diazotrophicus TaxID=1482074 RepID=A0A2C9D9T0_9HYPH|nr:CBS domain-containing protein [Hartmannibacter diazotrophicus]SON56345.1 Hypoxic response protein 1 [Hartmannibacter diazotrophicus]
MKTENAMHKGTQWVTPETSIAIVASMMKKQDIGAVPVGENDRLIGMITDRDLALRALADGHDTSRLTARDVMTKGVIYCKTEESLEDAVHLMEEKKIRRMPVIDKDKRMVGMLSLSDVSHHAGRELTGELVHAVASPH